MPQICQKKRGKNPQKKSQVFFYQVCWCFAASRDQCLETLVIMIDERDDDDDNGDSSTDNDPYQILMLMLML